MSQFVIAKRYAKALSHLAEQQQLMETVAAQVAAAAATWDESPELQRVLTDTKVGLPAKLKVMEPLLRQLEVIPLVATFITYLLTKRRIELLPDIARAFNGIVQEKLGRLEAQVTVAQAPAAPALQQLQEQLSRYTGKEVSVKVNVDPSLIGGVITRIGSVVIDGSIRSQLTQVRQSIIRG